MAEHYDAARGVLQMTMADWKAKHPDFKGTRRENGTIVRSALRFIEGAGTCSVPVEIVKRAITGVVLVLTLTSGAFAQAPTPARAAQTAPVARVQCAGITQKGLQCKRTVKAPATRCYQHVPKGGK